MKRLVVTSLAAIALAFILSSVLARKVRMYILCTNLTCALSSTKSTGDCDRSKVDNKTVVSVFFIWTALHTGGHFPMKQKQDWVFSIKLRFTSPPMAISAYLLLMDSHLSLFYVIFLACLCTPCVLYFAIFIMSACSPKRLALTNANNRFGRKMHYFFYCFIYREFQSR